MVFYNAGTTAGGGPHWTRKSEEDMCKCIQTAQEFTPEQRERLVRAFGPRILGEVKAGIVRVTIVRQPDPEMEEVVTFARIDGEVNGKVVEDTLVQLV